MPFHQQIDLTRVRQGVKLGRLHQRLYRLQYLRQLPGQRHRPRCRYHAAGLADEQGVVEHFAQSPQGLAHRRLRDEQTLCRARDMSLFQQRFQRHQQIKIQLSQFPYVHNLPQSNHNYEYNS